MFDQQAVHATLAVSFHFSPKSSSGFCISPSFNFQPDFVWPVTSTTMNFGYQVIRYLVSCLIHSLILLFDLGLLLDMSVI